MCKRILIVDDNDFDINILHKLINKYFSVEIETAKCVDEAIGLLETIAFNCVITDISMPGKSGHYLVRYLIEKGIPVIVITGYTPNTHYIDKRANAWLTKPFDWDLLIEIMKSTCKIQDHKQQVYV